MLIKFGCGGVDLSELHPAIWNAIKHVCTAWNGEEVVITSTWEGTHLPWSKHYQKQAIDVRLPSRQVQEKVQRLKQLLGHGYDVLIEKDHVHIEWDPVGK